MLNQITYGMSFNELKSLRNEFQSNGTIFNSLSNLNISGPGMSSIFEWTNDYSIAMNKTKLSYFDIVPFQHEESSLSRKMSTGGFQCSNFPDTYDPKQFCSGVVDYPFVLMDGYTKEILETKARTYANLLGVPILKTSCLSDIKRYICANIYLKCVTNGKPILYS